MSPKMIVIDSFRAVHDLAPSVPEMRRLIYELTGLLTAYETTLGLQFALEGARQGEPSLYVNFQENPSQLAPLRNNRMCGTAFGGLAVQLTVCDVFMSVITAVRPYLKPRKKHLRTG